MALEKITIPVNLTMGLDTKTDEKLALGMSIMENCSHQGKGTPKKRKQLTALPRDIEGGGQISSGKYAFGYGKQALMASNNAVYTFIESTQEWRKLAGLSLSTMQGEFVSKIETSQVAGMVKTTNEEAFVSSESTGDSTVYIRDLSTGVVKEVISADFDARLINVGDEIISVGWVGGVSPNLIFRNHSTGVTTTPITDTSGRFDIATDGTHIYVVYNTVGLVRVYKLNTDGTTDSTQTYAIGTDTIHTGSNPSIFYDGTNFHITFIVSRGGARWCRYFEIDEDLIVVTAQLDNFEFVNGSADVLSSIVVGTTGDTLLGPLSLWFFYNDRNASTSGYVELSLTNYLSLGNAPLRGVEIASRPFVYEDDVLVLAKQDNPESINWILLNTSFNPQGIINNIDTTSLNSLPVNSLNSVTSDFSLAFIDDGIYLKKADLDFSYSSSGDFVEFGGNTFLPGTLPTRYNGHEFIESQFLGRPAITDISLTGGAVPAGDYDYIAVYEYVEPNGNIVRSQPSTQVSISNPGPNGITMDITPLRVSFLDDSEIKIMIYRKLSGETVFRLIDEFVVNDRNASVGVVVDATNDNSENGALYTTGGVLANQVMPAILSYAFSNNRLFGIVSEDANEVLYSNKYVIGEGIFFNNFQSLNVEDNQNRRSDRLVALSGMDNKLILLKRNSILAVFGDGPDRTGANGAFSEPELVTTDIGCTSARSLTTTNDGIIFKSLKGIHLLARSMSSGYVGGAVEAFNGLEISGAILMEDINQVRWTTSDGEAIVYDYYYKTWSVFKNFESLGCFIHQGKMAIVKSDGSFLVEGDNFDDDGVFVKQKITTGWLKSGGLSTSGRMIPGGPQEFQRVYRMLILGEYKSTHKILVKVYYDYHDYPESEYLLTPQDANYETQVRPDPSVIEAGGNDGTYQYNIHFERQKCQAIKISIEDVQDGDPAESYQLTDITFVAGKKKGAFKTRKAVDY